MPYTSLSDPGEGVFTITPHDSNNLPTIARSVRVGTGGDVSFVGIDGVTTVIPDVLSGETIHCQCRRINATDTTASGFTGYK